MTPYISPNLPAFFEAGIRDIAAAPIPAPDGMSPQNSSKKLNNHAITITKSANYQESKALLEYMLEPKSIWYLTQAQEPGFFQPPTKTGMDQVNSGWIDKEFLPLKGFDDSKGSRDRAILRNFTEVGAGMNWKGFAMGALYGPVNLANTEIANAHVIDDMIQNALIENVAPADAVAWAQQKMQEVSDEVNPK
jgi:ABC-type glycerol-3-phosphate transport system substrate-binding protein